MHFTHFPFVLRAPVENSCLKSAYLFRAESCFLRIGGRGARIFSLIKSICFATLAISFFTLRAPGFPGPRGAAPRSKGPPADLHYGLVPGKPLPSWKLK